jgi:hypothetical protein
MVQKQWAAEYISALLPSLLLILILRQTPLEAALPVEAAKADLQVREAILADRPALLVEAGMQWVAAFMLPEEQSHFTRPPLIPTITKAVMEA